MNKRSFSKIRTAFTWLWRNLLIILSFGMFIACIIILMGHGEGFLQAVRGSYLLVSYFQSSHRAQSSDNSDSSVSIPLVAILLVVFMGIGIYLLVKGRSKK